MPSQLSQDESPTVGFGLSARHKAKFARAREKKSKGGGGN